MGAAGNNLKDRGRAVSSNLGHFWPSFPLLASPVCAADSSDSCGSYTANTPRLSGILLSQRF